MGMLARREPTCHVHSLPVTEAAWQHVKDPRAHTFHLRTGNRCACACREAIALDARHHRALKLLGSALYALGDLAGAQEALRASLAVNPAYADASCDLGARLQHASLAALSPGMPDAATHECAC